MDSDAHPKSEDGVFTCSECGTLNKLDATSTALTCRVCSWF
jgi:hypothetical protein